MSLAVFGTFFVISVIMVCPITRTTALFIIAALLYADKMCVLMVDLMLTLDTDCYSVACGCPLRHHVRPAPRRKADPTVAGPGGRESDEELSAKGALACCMLYTPLLAFADDDG